jgi:hypothetical protein
MSEIATNEQAVLEQFGYPGPRAGIRATRRLRHMTAVSATASARAATIHAGRRDDPERALVCVPSHQRSPVREHQDEDEKDRADEAVEHLRAEQKADEAARRDSDEASDRELSREQAEEELRVAESP